MPPTGTTKTLVITVDAKGVKEALDGVSNSMGKLNRSVKTISGNMGFLTDAFKGWLGFISVRELGQMSDTVQNLSNRLKITTHSAEEASAVFDGLIKIALQNHQSLSAVSDTYNRFAITLQRVGATSSEVLALTNTLIQTFRVASSSPEETANAMIQLSQAFSMGVLRGQDLRSVLSQNVVIAKALQTQYGQELFKKAEAGAISIAEVLKILGKIQKKVEEDARKLSVTFAQTLTDAMTIVTVKVGKFSEALSLPKGFNESIMFLLDHFNLLVGLLTSIAFYSAIANLEKFFATIKWGVTVAGLSRLGLIGGTVAAAGIAIATNWDSIRPVFAKVYRNILELDIAMTELNKKWLKFITLGGASGAALAPLNKQLFEDKQKLKEINNILYELAHPPTPPTVGTGPFADPKKYLKSLQDKMPPPLPGKLKDELAALNQQFISGAINLDKYYDKLKAFNLHKINREFKEGKNDVLKYHEELSNQAIQEYTRQLNKAHYSLEQFNVLAADAKLFVLNEQVRVGTIDLAKYNEEVLKFEDNLLNFRVGSAVYTGLHNFVESIGTVGQGVARVIEQAFNHLTDTLVSFIQTGKFEFKEFMKAIIDDITKMLVATSITRPIAAGILSMFGGGPTTTYNAGMAGSTDATIGFVQSKYGNVMTGNGPMQLHRYGAGGIANSPQMSLFGEGSRPEAYVPLPDGRSIPVTMDGGGVSVVQNITINSDGVSSSETTKGQNAKQLADIIKRVTVDTIIQQRRPGGILA